MRSELILSLIFAAFGFVLGICVFLKNTKSLLRLGFLLFSFGALVWATGFVLLLGTEDFFFNYLILLGAILGAGGLFTFSRLFPNQEQHSTFSLNDLFVVSPLLLLVPGVVLNSYISSAYVDEGVLVPVNEPGFLVFLLVIGGYLVASVVQLRKNFSVSNPLQRNQIWIFLLGISLFVGVVLVADLIFPLFGFAHTNVIGILSLSLLLVSGAYTLLAHRILDVRIILQKTIIYAVMFSLVSLVYLGFIFFLNHGIGQHGPGSVLVGGMLASLIGAFSLPIIDTYLRKVTNPWLFHQPYDYETTLLELSRSLAQASTLGEIIDLFTVELQEIFHASVVRVIIADDSVTQISDVPEFSEDHRCLLVPLVSKTFFVGTLYFGKKQSGHPYSVIDASFAETISYYLAGKLRLASMVEDLTIRSGILKNEVSVEQQEHERTKESHNHFVVDLAHNLKTPLTVLRGELESLTLDQVTLSESRFEDLSATIDRLSQFIDRLLQAGRNFEFHQDKVRLNLSDHLHEIGEYLSIIAESSDIDFSVELEPDIFVLGDQRSLEEVMVNLVSNAFSYRKQHGRASVLLTLSATGPNACIEVRDSGIGIEEHRIPYLFSRWSQTNERPGGSGLGLAIVKKIVEAHGGSVEIHSVHGVGTTVKVMLPKVRRVSL